jgi:hypothetical protein
LANDSRYTNLEPIIAIKAADAFSLNPPYQNIFNASQLLEYHWLSKEYEKNIGSTTSLIVFM